MSCGKTNHLTSFSLLLTGANNSKCGDDDDYIYAWLSLSFVALAIVFFCICIILWEIKLYYQRKQHHKEIIRIESTIRQSAKY